MRSQQWILRGTNGVESLFLEEVEIPDPGDYEIQIKLHAASLNFRDLKVARATRDGVVQGSDGAGEVVQVGPKVTRFTIGQRVSPIFHGTHFYGTLSAKNAPSQLGTFHDGALRQYAIFNEQACVAIPDNLSHREAATLPCAALTAWNALYGGSRTLKPGEIVLTQGTGGVSIFALQFAKLGGAQVIATTSSADKAERLTQLGADHVINYKEDAAWGQTARSLSHDGQGVDFVVEIGGSDTLRQSKLAAAIGAQLAIVGARARHPGGSGPQSNFIHDEETTDRRRIMVGSRQMQEEMNRLIQVSKLKPVIDEKVFSLAEVKEAYRYLEDAKHFGKVVVDIV
ncbi:hypothetical protein LTR84_009080 [Exophiala bonariae]|uniref:Enoyl reductase (ER) domain-containing protein n=1 Tax=Exophiala bonariae TaxID=1690606 RepID=A0AAV9MXR9_9EURO|nr:hypothetical protein LTR84_009080 [Exophiala bonariae]